MLLPWKRPSLSSSTALKNFHYRLPSLALGLFKRPNLGASELVGSLERIQASAAWLLVLLNPTGSRRDYEPSLYLSGGVEGLVVYSLTPPIRSPSPSPQRASAKQLGP